MASLKSRRLNLLLDLAKRDEQQAAELLAQQQTQVQQQQQQLQELHLYYQSYEKQFIQSRQSNALELAKGRTFLAQLQQACAAQEKALMNANEQLDRARLLWQKKHYYSDAIDELGERNRMYESKQLDKSEQKQIDELSSQALGRRK